MKEISFLPVNFGIILIYLVSCWYGTTSAQEAGVPDHGPGGHVHVVAHLVQGHRVSVHAGARDAWDLRHFVRILAEHFQGQGSVHGQSLEREFLLRQSMHLSGEGHHLLPVWVPVVTKTQVNVRHKTAAGNIRRRKTVLEHRQLILKTPLNRRS